LLPRRARVASLGSKVHKAARALAQPSVADLYESVMTQPPLGSMRLAQRAFPSMPSGADALRRLQFLDQTQYLPEDLLVKTDRAAMSVSLETRLPMLSREVVELSWRMPTRMLVRQGQGKWPLRELIARRMPMSLIDRPKQGFGVPLDDWIRGPLRGWATDLLHDSAQPLEEVVDAEAARTLLRDHLAGGDRAAQLWPILMLQAWRHRRGTRAPV
jgi:asparagine synthase (glutamine-hydrolysing)